ncbi:hypothetical protein L3i20_v244360 [Paenibacillus sp. L3-i20]|nr:hypothetical protein L3i20_v244360 [Paenibacillus sp. L3-i20]
MTFISTVITDRYLTVMADRRATSILPDGNYGDPVAEDAQKIIQVSKNSFYAIVGAVETTLSFMQVTKFEDTIFTRLGIIKEKNINPWLDENKNTLLSVPSSFQFIFGGLTSLGTYKVYSLDSKTAELSYIERESGKLNYNVFSSDCFPYQGEIAAIWLEEITTMHPHNTSRDMIRIQSELNDKVADVDKSVNKAKTIFVIDFEEPAHP